MHCWVKHLCVNIHVFHLLSIIGSDESKSNTLIFLNEKRPCAQNLHFTAGKGITDQ